VGENVVERGQTIDDSMAHIVQPDRPQMTRWSMSIACWIPNAINRHSQYVIIIAFPLQQWLEKRASLLRYTHIACPVKCD